VDVARLGHRQHLVAMTRTLGTTPDAPPAPRSVEHFQASAQALADQLDTFVVDRARSLTEQGRHALEDARMHILWAHRYLGRAQGHRHRSRRKAPAKH
jgi:hypothetical protein